MFDARLPLATAFVDLLADAGVTRGLIGPREVPRLWDRHLLNCAVLADLLPAGVDVADLGSGAGLPGLVLAIRRTDLQVTLVEPLLRRTTFLDQAVQALGLDNVEVLRSRAEALHGARQFSVVTSRALAPLPRLLEWSMPLVRLHGQLLAMKGSSAAVEVASAESELSRWTDAPADVLSVGAGTVSPPATVIRVEATRSSHLGWGADKNAARARRSDRGVPPSGRGRRGRHGDAHG